MAPGQVVQGLSVELELLDVLLHSVLLDEGS
jgi:hypothetical protein